MKYISTPCTHIHHAHARTASAAHTPGRQPGNQTWRTTRAAGTSGKHVQRAAGRHAQYAARAARPTSICRAPSHDTHLSAAAMTAARLQLSSSNGRNDKGRREGTPSKKIGKGRSILPRIDLCRRASISTAAAAAGENRAGRKRGCREKRFVACFASRARRVTQVREIFADALSLIFEEYSQHPAIPIPTRPRTKRMASIKKWLSLSQGGIAQQPNASHAAIASQGEGRTDTPQ